MKKKIKAEIEIEIYKKKYCGITHAGTGINCNRLTTINRLSSLPYCKAFKTQLKEKQLNTGVYIPIRCEPCLKETGDL